jgi:omega-6 fatty acid desaturase (delta-12 desaturase)
MKSAADIRDMLRLIPRECYRTNAAKATGYFIRDFALIVVTVLAMYLLNSWWATPLAILLGSFLTSFFILGHDAGHRSFCRSRRHNNCVGHLTTSLVLWPFHIWRLSHNVHHRHTHHVDKEIAWRPETCHAFCNLSRFRKLMYRAYRTYGAMQASVIFAASAIRRYIGGKGLTRTEHREALFSVAVTLVIATAYVGLAYVVSGWYGLVTMFLIPQLVFHFWLSLFTLLHHTTPDTHFLSAADWTREKASLARTIHVVYPGWVDSMSHDISWHVPHHVCPAIPHYNLRRAYASLRSAYSDQIVEKTFSISYLMEVLRCCHLIDGPDPEWVRFRDAGNSIGPVE